MEENHNLASLIGRNIRIDRGGPESRTGRLLGMKEDHLVVYEEKEGVIYYKRHHIKSIGIDARENSDLGGEDSGDMPAFVDATCFCELLSSLQYRWVQINRGGPEKIEGVLGDVFPDRVLLIVNNEIVVIFKYHIRSISVGAGKKEDKAKGEKEDKAKGEKENNKTENHKKESDQIRHVRYREHDDDDDDDSSNGRRGYYFNTRA